MIQLVVSLAHDGITAWEPPRGAGWLFPVYCTCGLVVGCWVHVSLLGALWAPSTSLSRTIVTSTGLVKNLQKLDYNGFGVM